jgi:hypothetical protein
MNLWNLPILAICVALCITEAIAQSEQGLIGAARIEKRASGMFLPGTRTGVAVSGIQSFADETCDCWVRQPALQITNPDGADSSKLLLPGERFLISFAYSQKTYIPAIGVTFRHIGAYFPEVSFPLTFMDTDTGSTGCSYTVFLTLTFGILGEWLAGEVLGARWLQLGIRYGLFLPALALNSYHHLVLIGKGGAMETPLHELTAFLGWRTDLWEDAQRWTPMAGLQYSFVEAPASTGIPSGGMGLCIGVQAPMDLSSHGKEIPAGFFVGLKWYLWARN